MQKINPFVVTSVIKLHEDGYSSRRVAEFVGYCKSTVNDVLRRAKAADLTYAKAQELGFMRTAEMLYPPKPNVPDDAIVEKHQRFLKDKTLTKKDLWEEYIQENPDGVKYSQFCEKMNQLKPRRRTAKRPASKSAATARAAATAKASSSNQSQSPPPIAPRNYEAEGIREPGYYK
jgi:hypothetical protein